MKVITYSLLALHGMVLCLILSGCGGGGPEPAAVPAPAPAPAPAAAPVVVAPPQDKETTIDAPTVRATVVVPQPDLFIISATPKPNYIILGMKQQSVHDFFAVKIPPENFNSSSYRIAAIPPAMQETTRNPAFYVPQGYTELPEYGYADDGVPKRIKSNFLGTDMVYIPPGVTSIGKARGFENAPLINTFLDGYYIDVHETTIRDYLFYRKKQQDEKKRVPVNPPNANDAETKPILGIHWGQARSLLKEYGKDLPTESEWEKAARGPQSFPNPWGYGPPLWPSYRHVNEISDVGTRAQDVSPYGVHDMAGNAKEWCLDYYAPDAYNQAIKQDNTPKNWLGPKQPNPKNTKVVRGSVNVWDVTYRQGMILSEGHPDVGFRGVIRLGPAPEPQPTTPANTDPTKPASPLKPTTTGKLPTN